MSRQSGRAKELQERRGKEAGKASRVGRKKREAASNVTRVLSLGGRQKAEAMGRETETGRLRFVHVWAEMMTGHPHGNI